MIQIRVMRQDEKKAVYRVMRKAFAPFLWLFFYLTKDVLVAEDQGEIVGCVVLKVRTKWEGLGLIAWICTHPKWKGKGIGQMLIDEGIQVLEERGCKEIAASVEGYNTSSAKLFSHRGFRQFPVSSQFTHFGWRIFAVWWSLFHFFDVGHFLWIKTEKELSKNSKKQFPWTILIQSVFFLFAYLRWNQFKNVGGGDFIAILLAFTVIYLIRFLPMLAVANAYKLKTEYRVWESAHVLNGLVSLLFAGVVPAPGGLYPADMRYTYRDKKQVLGLMALFSNTAMLTFLIIMKLFLFNVLEGIVPAGTLNTFYSVAMNVVLLDVFFPFMPLVSYNSRRVWDYNKIFWFLHVAVLIFLFNSHKLL